MTVVETRNGIATSNAEWWRSAVVYQVYPRSFADSDGDGIGDLLGIRSRLDYLQNLDVDVIWLSPIYCSPQDDNGYDISDYEAIDPVFGTLDDFDNLLADVHSRGMKLVMDLVVNHTSDEHPWFVESASSRENPKRDWYVWRDQPNNWESFFSGSAWQWHDETEQHFLHLFSRKQPDLNWENGDVRQSIYAMMRWWLDRGVDGFRMDVINLISKDPGLPNGKPIAGTPFGDGFPHFSYGPRVHEYLQEMNESVFGGRSGTYLTVGEMPGVTVEQAQRFTDPARGEVNMVFQFEHVGLDHGPSGKWEARTLDLVELKESMAKWQQGLGDVGWNSLYWNNHDQPRAVSRFGDDGEHREKSAQALGAILHLQRGTPFVYQGEELGMTNVHALSIDHVSDIESLNFYQSALAAGTSQESAMASIQRIGRDNARTPMQWGPTGGFSDGEPWIALNPNTTVVNAAAQVGVEGSVFEFYRTLIALRHEVPAVVHGDFRLVEPLHPTLFAFERRFSGTLLTVAANFGTAPLSYPIAGEWLLGNYEQAEGPLRPWEVRIYRQDVE
ncbi:alpha-glucosidase [Marisediminicola antarctica]|uniref:Glucohydrolase n=1 Tax=Marisediminicola antarctica TaxID=674079 RepID=A0A7L5AIB6_9MICO|nr:alpha-glucosidase [Marisediminicola antarctica]QHO70310.1 glucohydrolase [Marisediminicola antarctica]